MSVGVENIEKAHHTKEEGTMTTLGAALYGGFFGIAALWLFLTSDAVGGRRDQRQVPERSNSASTALGADASNPALASHSSLK